MFVTGMPVTCIFVAGISVTDVSVNDVPVAGKLSVWSWTSISTKSNTVK